ncbi:hypothetical protein NIES39_R00800 [Arthrospira platensis NIES-39]|nr:hypothetical protein NIES39_R00800 [Arthrospira platensis NIES-39]
MWGVGFLGFLRARRFAGLTFGCSELRSRGFRGFSGDKNAQGEGQKEKPMYARD